MCVTLKVPRTRSIAGVPAPSRLQGLHLRGERGDEGPATGRRWPRPWAAGEGRAARAAARRRRDEARPGPEERGVPALAPGRNEAREGVGKEGRVHR